MAEAYQKAAWFAITVRRLLLANIQCYLHQDHHPHSSSRWQGTPFLNVLESWRQITAFWMACFEVFFFFFPLIKTYVAPKPRKQQESLGSAEGCVCTLGSQQEPNQTRPGLTQAWASLSPFSPRRCTRLLESLQELWSTSLPNELGKLNLFRWVVFEIRIPTT